MVIIKGSALSGTNILIDLFNDRSEAKLAIGTWPSQNTINLITWVEVMAGAEEYHQEARTHVTLGAFNVVGISQDIAERSVSIRQEHGMKLSDAIVLAIAQTHRLALVTRNTKDLAGILGVVTPYTL